MISPLQQKNQIQHCEHPHSWESLRCGSLPQRVLKERTKSSTSESASQIRDRWEKTQQTLSTILFHARVAHTRTIPSEMCIYYTYHFNCCPGTARPAPYYVHSICSESSTSKKFAHLANKNGGARTQVMDLEKCRIQHEILDGAEADIPCPKCG